MTSFDAFVPAPVVGFCTSLQNKYGFEMRIVRPRKTRLGSTTHYLRTGRIVIRINSDLRPYAFLFTYLHEVAHAIVCLKQVKESAHGPVWKSQYRSLMAQVTSKNVFPRELNSAICTHMNNLTASSCTNSKLRKLLTKYDGISCKFVGDLPDGAAFKYKDASYKRIRLLCTRILCERHDGKRFAFRAHAPCE